ncbi:MAG: hypothetical protein MZV65_29155 [Chromatiales bacterium]|nr:hypothetical protein [Chromatiales bacterium]
MSLAVLAFLAGAVIAVKNVVLRQIRGRIESTLHYGRMRLTVILPGARSSRMFDPRPRPHSSPPRRRSSASRT